MLATQLRNYEAELELDTVMVTFTEFGFSKIWSNNDPSHQTDLLVTLLHNYSAELELDTITETFTELGIIVQMHAGSAFCYMNRERAGYC